MYYLVTRDFMNQDLEKTYKEAALPALFSLSIMCLTSAYKTRQTFDQRKNTQLPQIKRALDD